MKQKLVSLVLCLALVLTGPLGGLWTDNSITSKATQLDAEGTEPSDTTQSKDTSVGVQGIKIDDTSSETSSELSSQDTSSEPSSSEKPSEEQSSEATTEYSPITFQYLSYSSGTVETGNLLSIMIKATADFDNMQTKQFRGIFGGDSGSNISVTFSYDKEREEFVGNTTITSSVLKGTYGLLGFYFTDKKTGKERYVSLNGNKLGTFQRTVVTLVSTLTPASASYTVKVGGSKQVSITVAPDTATKKDLVYSSDNESIVKISPTGVITGVTLGSTYINVAATDGSGVVIKINVKVQKQLVIVLDPGHGGNDAGATNSRRGLYERNINLRIAKACRDELEKYQGVTVYLTRQTNGKLPSLKKRAQIAKSYNADALISLHINSSYSGGPYGSEVWVTRYKASAKYNKNMKKLASKILSNLVTDCGFAKRGIYTRKSGTSRYRDGSVADYYGVIRESVYLKVPAMIVEHGFINNSRDAVKMNSLSKCNKMGIADAKGIASYYGLVKKGENETSLVTDITINGDKNNVGMGQSLLLSAVVTPSGAVNKQVRWESLDPSIATVSSNGTVTGVARGSTYVKVSALDGSGCESIYQVNVINAVTKVSISKTNKTVKLGKTYQIKTTVSPIEADIKKVEYFSSNTYIASVTAKGKVKAKRRGTVIITAMSTDGSFKADTITIKVK